MVQVECRCHHAAVRDAPPNPEGGPLSGLVLTFKNFERGLDGFNCSDWHPGHSGLRPVRQSQPPRWSGAFQCLFVTEKRPALGHLHDRR